jgi:hypothetical protein
MENPEISSDFKVKTDQIKINLKSWTLAEWVLFFMVIPAILVLIYALPQEIKNTYFILNSANLWNLQSWLLNGYTHSELYPHLETNIVVYFIALIAIFSFENNKRRFWIMAGSSFLLVPLIASLLTIGLFHILGMDVNSQGFSAVVAALVAYTIISLVLWMLSDRLNDFDHPLLFRSRMLFFLLCGLLTTMLALIIVGGLSLGIFMNTGESTSNGIAHFGGFITGVIIFLVYDALTEKRMYFQLTLGIAIVMGILWYGNYLVNLIQTVKGV